MINSRWIEKRKKIVQQILIMILEFENHSDLRIDWLRLRHRWGRFHSILCLPVESLAIWDGSISLVIRILYNSSYGDTLPEKTEFVPCAAPNFIISAFTTTSIFIVVDVEKVKYHNSLMWSFPQYAFSDEKTIEMWFPYFSVWTNFRFCCASTSCLKWKHRTKSVQFGIHHHWDRSFRRLTHLWWPKNCNCSVKLRTDGNHNCATHSVFAFYLVALYICEAHVWRYPSYNRQIGAATRNTFRFGFLFDASFTYLLRFDNHSFFGWIHTFSSVGAHVAGVVFAPQVVPSPVKKSINSNLQERALVQWFTRNTIQWPSGAQGVR